VESAEWSSGLVITNVYVDGFNLYYGCLGTTAYRWRDLEALCHRLFPNDSVHRSRNFTAGSSARTPDRQAPQQQQAYIRALETSPVLTAYYGHFLSHPARKPLLHPPNISLPPVQPIKPTRRGPAFNLAPYLLSDGFTTDCETAVVISNESDLKLPVAMVQQGLNIPVGIVNPHPAVSVAPPSNPRPFSRSARRISTCVNCQ
jgi:hypothetical protein